MAGQSFAQKILAQKAGVSRVQVGEIVTVAPDHVMTHDNTAAIIGTFRKMGVEKLADPKMPLIFLDHIVPAAAQVYAENHYKIRAFVREQGIPHFYDCGNGVCHTVLYEHGHAVPGSLILGSDSHTSTAGAFGLLAPGIGRTEAAAVWATGQIWLRVPESMRFVVDGPLPPAVQAKDLILEILRLVRSDGADYRCVEFVGPAIDAMDMEERVTLTNMAAEMGAKAGVCFVDEHTRAFLENNGLPRDTYEEIRSDPDTEYVEEIAIDGRSLGPKLACPHKVDNVCDVEEYLGMRVHQVVIGACTNGKYHDLEIAAKILKGRRVANGVRLIVIPASRNILSKAIASGVLADLVDAGAMIGVPGCGPCLGAHMGILAPGEVCVSTTNRNFKGRMGCPDADIYLASPYTAAATAVAGRIADPREEL